MKTFKFAVFAMALLPLMAAPQIASASPALVSGVSTGVAMPAAGTQNAQYYGYRRSYGYRGHSRGFRRGFRGSRGHTFDRGFRGSRGFRGRGFRNRFDSFGQRRDPLGRGNRFEILRN